MVALAALLGAGFGLGWLAILAGARRRNPAVPARSPRVGVTRELVIRIAVAVVVAALVGLLTRWPVGAVLAGIAAYALPIALGSNKAAERALTRTEAVAIWAEMLRDNMSAAAGLEQAIIVTAPFAPAAIREDIDELTAALRLGQRLPVALTELRARIDDRTGRLVVRALLQASQRQSRDLANLLTELASRARARANLHLKIAPGHAKIRTNARIITGFTLAMAAGLIILNPAFLEPYNSLPGQLMLLVVGAVFAAGFLGIARLAKVGLDKAGPR